MTVPEPTSPTKKASLVSRIAMVFGVIFAVLLGMVVLGAALGAKKKEEQAANAPQVQPTQAQAVSTTATTPTEPAKPKPLTIKEQVTRAEADVQLREALVQRLIAELRKKMDTAGEGVETRGEVILIATNIERGHEDLAFSVLERSTNHRVLKYRPNFLELRNAQRLVVASSQNRDALYRQAFGHPGIIMNLSCCRIYW